jgi:hypothetical protein
MLTNNNWQIIDNGLKNHPTLVETYSLSVKIPSNMVTLAKKNSWKSYNCLSHTGIFLSLSGKYSPQINATHNVSATHPLIPTSHSLLVVSTWVSISLYFTSSNK